VTVDARSVYRQATGQSASPVHLVVLLYEQMVDDLHRALAALANGSAEVLSLEVGHALEVLGQLQGRLDMARGGEVSRNLESFYNLTRTSLIQAQVQSSADILRKQVASLLTLREAWMEVERIEGAGDVAAPATANTAAATAEKKLSWSV